MKVNENLIHRQTEAAKVAATERKKKKTQCRAYSPGTHARKEEE
jgi:hypothetical protein